MSQPPPPEAGPLHSLRSIGASFVALLHTRIELAVLELREEGQRRKEMLVLGAVAGVFLTLAALLLAAFVVIVFWDTHRLAAAGGVTAAYFAIGVVALARMRGRARDNPPPFEATLAELARDVQALKGRDD